MERNSPSGWKTLAVVAAHIVAFPLLGSAFALPEVVLPIVAIPAAALAIWIVVRLTNRQDDPRHTNPHPDHP